MNLTGISISTILAIATLGGMAVDLHAQTGAPEERLLLSDAKALIEQSMSIDTRIIRSNLADLEETDIREAPASIVVLSARQIEAAGARDLFEALQLIPGLSFGRDVDDVIGVAIHGNWAEEGKCLFLLDGKQLNENDFGTYAVGNRIPLANVERIEVVMGPGSVLHGGYAALGVINIVTRSADQGTGSKATLGTGWSNGRTTRSSASISGAHRLSRNQEISYLTSHIRGQRSNALGLLPDSTLLSFADSTGMQSSTFQFNYRWKSLKASMHYMEETFNVSDARYDVHLRDIVFGIEQQVQLTKHMHLAWKLNYADQLPWYYINSAETDRIASNTTNQRSTAHVSARFRPIDWFAARIGIQGYHQRSEFQVESEDARFTMNGRPSVTMADVGAFAEIGLKGRWGNLLGGYRLEHNTLSGSFAAPRVSYTKAAGRVHLKAMWSRAFRTPTVMNLNYGPEDGTVVAEYVTTAEAETGLRLGKATWLTLNVYETRIEDPIVYVYDAVTYDNYINRAFSGTHGLDMRFNRESKRSVILGGLGIYRALPNTDLPEIQLPDSLGAIYQALPQARGFLVASWDLMPTLTVRGKVNWQSGTWSYQYANADDGTGRLVAWPEELVLGTGIIWRPKAASRVQVDLAVSDLLDVTRTILSPFNNGTTPFTMNGREFRFVATYKFVQ